MHFSTSTFMVTTSPILTGARNCNDRFKNSAETPEDITEGLQDLVSYENTVGNSLAKQGVLGVVVIQMVGVIVSGNHDESLHIFIDHVFIVFGRLADDNVPEIIFNDYVHVHACVSKSMCEGVISW